MILVFSYFLIPNVILLFTLSGNNYSFENNFPVLQWLYLHCILPAFIEQLFKSRYMTCTTLIPDIGKKTNYFSFQYPGQTQVLPDSSLPVTCLALILLTQIWVICSHVCEITWVKLDIYTSPGSVSLLKDHKNFYIPAIYSMPENCW